MLDPQPFNPDRVLTSLQEFCAMAKGEPGPRIPDNRPADDVMLYVEDGRVCLRVLNKEEAVVDACMELIAENGLAADEIERVPNTRMWVWTFAPA